MQRITTGLTLRGSDNEQGESLMGEIGEPDRVVRREREPAVSPSVPVELPALEPASH